MARRIARRAQPKTAEATDSTDVSVEVTPFWTWLKATSEGLGYVSEAALARGIGVSPSTVMRWREGSKPSIKQLVVVSQVLGVRLESLLVLAGLVPRDAVGDGGVPEPPSSVTPTERMIRDADLPPHIREVFQRYWELRLKEERARLSDLMSLIEDLARNKGSVADIDMEQRMVRILETKIADHIIQALNQSKEKGAGLTAEGRRRRLAHRPDPRLRPGDVVDISIEGVSSARVAMRRDGLYRFELAVADNKVVLESGPFASEEDAESGLKVFMESFAMKAGSSAPNKEEDRVENTS